MTRKRTCNTCIHHSSMAGKTYGYCQNMPKIKEDKIECGGQPVQRGNKCEYYEKKKKLGKKEKEIQRVKKKLKLVFNTKEVENKL